MNRTLRNIGVIEKHGETVIKVNVVVTIQRYLYGKSKQFFKAFKNLNKNVGKQESY